MAETLTGWGRTAPSAATVLHPDSAADVARLLGEPSARGVLPRGLGRAYGDAAQNGGGTVLDVRGLDHFTLSDDGLLRAGGGAGFDAILRESVPRGWFLPVSPGTRYVTVGGAIAADVHGKNHHVDGALGAHVAEIVLATPLGERRLTPADELFHATTGGMGLTGVIVEATIRMKRVHSSRVVVDTDRARDLDHVLALMDGGDHAYDYSVAWIDCLARGARLGRSVLTRGRFADDGRFDYDPNVRLRVPPLVPGGLLGTATVRAFNEAWFRKAPRERRGEVQSIPQFFHPLDGVRDWNRLYGPRGFLQYQFVVPFGAEDVLRGIVESLAAHPAPGFLAVLKRFGAEGPGHLSFPMPGWTLAIDLPAATPGLGALLDGFDERVLAAGGRLYLAKDSRARPELLRAGYPRLAEWRAVRAQADPHAVLTSDLSRRLGLTADTAAARLRLVSEDAA
ncbi:MAG: FAD-binding protein [Solirubrobacteraceae bacterium]